MPPPTRITIRLPPDLAARLVAHGGQLADIVRQALDAYLGGDATPGLPRPSGTAAISAAMADRLSHLTATVAATEERLEGLGQRVTALEAASASGSQTAASLAAVQAHLAIVEERLTAIEAVAAHGSHQQPWQPPRQPSQTPGAYDRDATYARIQALQVQGLTQRQIAAQLTAEGMPTKQGGPWGQSSVRYLLQTHGG